jgi:hypothetical protein
VSAASSGVRSAAGFSRWHGRLPLRLWKRRLIALVGRRVVDA